jgi:Ca-activated chloride channel family protein
MIHFAHPFTLLWLVAVPVIAAAFAWGDRKRASAGARFSSATSRQVDLSRRKYKRICVLAAVASLILALAKPVGKGSLVPPDAKGGDVVFLLDVSRSMLSADVLPTRLARAKAVIAALTRQIHGERIALVAFAGVPSVQCPLTIDEGFFQTMLESASPDSVARGGTRIGDAIQFSLESVFDGVVRARRQLVLVTDGGDQDSAPMLAARSAASRGIRLLVIGVGDETIGALVPVSESDPTPVLYHGAQVRTRLEPGVLQAIAAAGAGNYAPAGTREFDAAAVSQQFMAAAVPALTRDGESPASLWLVIFAALLLSVEMCLSDRRARAAVVAAVLIADLSAQSPAEWIANGNDAFKRGLWPEAAEDYKSAIQLPPMRPETYFNLGAALYKMKEYTSASDAFAKAEKGAHGTPLEDASKLAQANCAYRLAIGESQPWYEQKLRRVLKSYEELPAIPDAQFNAEVVRRRLADLQLQSPAAPQTPSTRQKAFGARNIVRQGGVPGKPKTQSVDKDW